jgi:hypothetical protein
VTPAREAGGDARHIRRTAGIPDAAATLPWSGHKFSGDINGLNPLFVGSKAPFLLASIARILYPIVCLAYDRLRP